MTNASAIKAPRAETRSGSVEDESAVAKPDAQNRSSTKREDGPRAGRGCEAPGRKERLSIAPIAFGDAAAFVREHHRHHTPPAGHKFSLAAVAGEQLVGVAIVGRPVARHRDDGRTLEVTRLCTNGHRNACSFLYGAVARATFALGYRRLGTYTLKTEPGTTLKAAGWKVIAEVPGRSWTTPTRPRTDKHPIEPKLLWEIAA